jgi:hypothetical protein
MSFIAFRILLFCLVPLGIFLLVKGIQWIGKTLGGIVILDVPLEQTEATFTVPKEGNYAIWQKGRTLQKISYAMPVPNINNEQTGHPVKLNYPLARVTSNNGSTGRIRIYTFYAQAGHYRYELPNNTPEQNSWRQKLEARTKNKTSGYFLEIKESKPTLWLVAGILLILVSAFCIIGGLVFSLNPAAVW